MPEFSYRYITEEGTVLESVIDANSKFDVYEVAEKRNEMVLSVKIHKQPFDLEKWINSFRRVSSRKRKILRLNFLSCWTRVFPLLDV